MVNTNDEHFVKRAIISSVHENKFIRNWCIHSLSLWTQFVIWFLSQWHWIAVSQIMQFIKTKIYQPWFYVHSMKMYKPADDDIFFLSIPLKHKYTLKHNYQKYNMVKIGHKMTNLIIQLHITFSALIKSIHQRGSWKSFRWDSCWFSWNLPNH